VTTPQLRAAVDGLLAAAASAQDVPTDGLVD
jgi:hypothetical protein